MTTINKTTELRSFGLLHSIRSNFNKILYSLCAVYLLIFSLDPISVPLVVSWLLIAACIVKLSMQGHLDSLELSLNLAFIYVILAPCL